jgi:hypothetical protein
MDLHWPPERTLMQETQPYRPEFDARADAIAVYGVDDTLPARMAAWRARSYTVTVMLGAAWGTYQHYLLGGWDGHEHWDEAQYVMDPAKGVPVPKQHGKDIPYMVPTESYGTYLEGLVRAAVDAGAEAIFIEEPEFWSLACYGGAFERAWQAEYGIPWRDPAGDPEAWALSGKLKHRLYHQLLARLCAAAKQHSLETGRAPVRCYVATHSLLNYAAWSIVSPELSLRSIAPIDGYIVQTWSFTARSRTRYEGRGRERLFAVAFLEYGSGIELARGTDRHLWFLVDPVEDRPNQGWDFYRTGYETTVAAALCWPEVGAYEIMPWPRRVFTGRYPRQSATGGEPIPAMYAREILAIAEAMRTMPAGPVIWDCGTRGLGVSISDSLLWPPRGPGQTGTDLSVFYGLALPLLLAGMPVRPVSLEVVAEGLLNTELRAILLSYDGLTPPSAAAHNALARWVHAGGALLCFGEATGTYETLPGWWNQSRPGTSPLPDLFTRLGLGPNPSPGIHRSGDGVVLVEPRGPAEIAMSDDGGALIRKAVQVALALCENGLRAYREQPYLLVRRGPYVIAAAPADAPDGLNGSPLTLLGRYIDLFDGDLPVRTEVALQPGGQLFLLDLDRLPQAPLRSGAKSSADACVAAAAARIDDEQVSGRSLSFRASGPLGTTGVFRIRLPATPQSVSVGGATAAFEWDPLSGTCRILLANQPEGVTAEIVW